MSTSLDIDVAALVGEMEAPACEHPKHGDARQAEFHSDEPASHYSQTHCRDCAYCGPVTPVCPGFVATVMADTPTRCINCGAVASGLDIVTILGPVNK